MEETVVVFADVARVADAALISELSRCVRADRAVTARLLVHLGEVDARGLYRERAWSSMFAYVVEELHMSEAEAYPRIAAARLSRRFPRIVELLAEGALHLTGGEIHSQTKQDFNRQAAAERQGSVAPRHAFRAVWHHASEASESRLRLWELFQNTDHD